MKIEIESFYLKNGDQSNVVSLPWRKYPGIVIQGDTLNSYVNRLHHMLDLAKSKNNQGLIDELEDLYQNLLGHQKNYEEILSNNQTELPYVK